MILSILKIIGIVLLVILALLILILGIILFVPIRYRFAGEYEKKPQADILVKWSPILLKATVNYKDDKLEYVVRMLGGVVMTNLDIPLSWIGRKFFSSDGEDDYDYDDESDEDDIIPTSPQSKRGLKKKESAKKDFVILDDEIELERPQADTEKLEADNRSTMIDKGSEKSKHKKPKQSVVKKIRQKIQDIKRKIQHFIEKMKKLNEKREALLTVYHHKRFEVAKRDVIAYIKILWDIIKPKHLEGRIHFGMNDPASTGQALGVMAMFLVWYHDFLRIEPDFEKACFDGNLKGNGKIRLFSVVKLVIKVLLNKNLIKVIKKVQTIIEA